MTEAAARHPELFARLKTREPDFVPAGGESLTQLFSRAVIALTEIARTWPGDQVLVVTHGGVLDCAWRAAKRLPLDTKRDHELFNASINRVTVLGDHFEFAGWGDVAHLT